MLINNKLETQSNSNQYLNLEGFIEFHLQLAYAMFNDVSRRPSVFLPLLFGRMRDASYASKTPLFQAMFEELSVYEDQS